MIKIEILIKVIFDISFDLISSFLTGGCEVNKTIQFLGNAGANPNKTLIQLVTDRNDDGKNFNGVDFDVHYVQICHASNCAKAGGFCTTDGFCVCDGAQACDCPCEEPEDYRERYITIGVVCVVVLLLALLFLVYFRKNQEKLKMQADLLKSKDEELKSKETELQAFSLGTSKFGDAVNYIDSLLARARDPPRPNAVPSSLLSSPGEVEKLLVVKQCLISGNDKKIHIPGNLEKASGHRFIMKEFSGHDSVNISNGFATASISSGCLDDPQPQDLGIFDCLPEFTNLDTCQQASLFRLLSLSNLRQWDFNCFEVSAIDEENTLLFVAWAIIGSPHSQIAMAKQLGQSHLEISHSDGYNFAKLDLKVDMVTLFDYVRAIQRDYKPTNPYHNAIHAADVVQTVHSLITTAGKFTEKEEIFSILVAAVVHDVKHPGMNNSYQVNTLSTLALTHNDAAVLENEHSSHAFKIMLGGLPDMDSDLNFLPHVTPSKFAAIRKKMVETVLHTGMFKQSIVLNANQ